VGQDGLLSDYGYVEMYPGTSVWAVLALGAGIILLSGLQWKIESASRSEDDGSSLAKKHTNSLPTRSSHLLESRPIEGDRRWKRSARSGRRDWIMIYAGRGASSWSGGYREMEDDESSGRIFHGRGDGEAPGEFSRRDQRLEIARIDDPAVETRMSREFAEREEPTGRKKSDAGRRINVSPTLRNDRSEEEIIGGIEMGSGADRRVSRIDDVSRSARVSASQQASINADNDLGSLVRRHARDSDDDHRDGRGDAVASADDDGENSRASLAEDASNLELSSRRKIAEGGAQRYSAGMQEDQLLFFRDNRERVQSSAMSPAELISDRKDLPGERDREDLASKRRHGASRDWFTRTWSRSQNFRRRAGEIATRGTDNGARRERILEGYVKVAASNAEARRSERSIVGRHERDSGSERYDESDAREELPIDEEGGLQDPSSKDSNDESSDEIEADKQGFASNAFQIFDSVIPPDNKRRKVTRGEDSKELMIAGDFVWTSQDRGIGKSLIPLDFRPISVQNAPRRGSKKRARAIVEENRGLERRIDGSTIRATGDRRKRYANYYSAQSATPMAYVHIQPAYPVLPPTNRKCTRCMVVYKPCPSPPLGIVLPSYRYHEPAIKWRGFKYGE